MNNLKYLSIIKKRLWLIISLTLISTLITAITTFFFITPLYKCDISVIIGGNPNSSTPQDCYDIATYQKLVKTYCELLTSRRVLDDVIDTTKIDISSKKLSSMIQISTKSESEFITVSVIGKDPKSITLIANQLVVSLKNVSKEIRGSDNVILVDTADTPTTPYKPNNIVNIALSFIISVIFSICLAILLDYLDQRIKNKDEIKELINVPILAEIPNFSTININNEPNYLFTAKSPKSVASEAISILRTNLQFCNINSNQKKILITSSSSNEGKSTILCNLAISIALTNKKVVILDCDMRKPTIHKFFSLSNLMGLSHILSNQAELEECLQASGIQNLSILTSGVIPPNPSELISSNTMKNLLNRLSSKYDIILIDAPPVPIVADAQILATMVDGVVLLTKYEYTTKNSLLSTKEVLDTLNTNIIGAIINNIPINTLNNSYDYEN